MSTNEPDIPFEGDTLQTLIDMLKTPCVVCSESLSEDRKGTPFSVRGKLAGVVHNDCEEIFMLLTGAM